MFWFNEKRGTQSLRQTGMLEWNYHLRPTHLHWGHLEELLLSRAARSKFVRRTLASLKSSVNALLWRQDLTLRLQSLNLNGMWGNWIPGGRCQVLMFNCQRQGRYDGQQSQSSNQNSLTHADLQNWLIDYGHYIHQFSKYIWKYYIQCYPDPCFLYMVDQMYLMKIFCIFLFQITLWTITATGNRIISIFI